MIRTFLCLALLLELLPWPVLTAQAQAPPARDASGIETEDLADAELVETGLVDPGLDLQALREFFQRGEELFSSADQPESLAPFESITERLAPRLDDGSLGQEGLALFTASLAYQARVHLNLGDTDLASAALERALAADPSFDLDRNLVSPKLLELFDPLRNEVVAVVELSVFPDDAEIRIDGKRRQLRGGSLGVLPGSVVLQVSRPGYAPFEQAFELSTGDTLPLDLELERTSAVLWVSSRPVGASVLIDGQLVGTTGALEPLLGGTPGKAGGFSAELPLEDIPLGSHVLEVRLDGHRIHRSDIYLDELIDYRAPPIVLVEERGRLLLTDLPDGAQVFLNGKLEAERGEGRRLQIEVDPGEHDLRVIDKNRVFTTRLRVADRQRVDVKVQPRPALTWLGALGGNARQTQQVQYALEAALGNSDRWAFLNHAERAAELAKADLDAARLDALTAGGGEPPDWEGLRRRIRDQAPGMVYVLAVIADELVATEADFWIWSSDPAPARPDRLRIPLEDVPTPNPRLARALGPGLELSRPWLGALVVDIEPEGGPVIVHLTPSGPAEAAGLRLGDRILSAFQMSVNGQADLDSRLHSATAGEAVELVVTDGRETRTVTVTLGSSPVTLVRDDRERLDALIFADLELKREAGDGPGWLVDLDQALLLLWAEDPEAAVRRLRDIRAPQEPPGVGQAAVDYWLGVALSAAGPRFRDSAIEALGRAASDLGGRLEHHDGPWVAPRARARLKALGAGS